MKKIAILTVLLLVTAPAYAYIDPGTGSFLLQGLVASFFAGLFTIKMYWQRFKTFIFRKKGQQQATECISEINDKQ